MTPVLLLLTLVATTPGDIALDVVDGGVVVADAGTAFAEGDANAVQLLGGGAAPTALPPSSPSLSSTTPAPVPPPGIVDHGDAMVRVAVVVDELTTPVFFQLAASGKQPRRRAAEASAAFAAALRTPPVANMPSAQVVVRDGLALVKVRGRTVAALSSQDAIAAGATSMPAFAEELETHLVEFVGAYDTRSSLQDLAFHVFFAVFLAVLAVLTLRGLNGAISRANTAIEDRAATIKPLTMLGIQLLSSDAVRGLLGTALVMGRVAAVLGVVVVAVAGILAQFDRTRPLLESLAAAAGRPVLTGLETFIAAMPGLLLAGLLLVVLRGSLRFLQLVLDGVADGRVRHGVVPPARAPAARVALTGAVVLVAMPLIIGAAFGRFGTPLESLALGAAGVVLLAMVPMLASAVVGVSVMWCSTVKAGDWVEVDAMSGEVSAVFLTELVLVPTGGGTVVIPMLLLALRPLRRLGRQPRLEQLVRVERTAKTMVLMDTLVTIARSVDADGNAELVEVDAESVLVRLSVPVGKSDAHNALNRAVLNAVDLGTITPAAGRRHAP